MEILGFGLPEIVLILLLALVILGPRDMTDSARRLARWVYRLFHSPQWREFIGIAQETRELPRQLLRDTGIEEELEMLKQTGQEVRGTVQQVNNTAREATAGLQPPPPKKKS